jgi:hypothetical protein
MSAANRPRSGVSDGVARHLRVGPAEAAGANLGQRFLTPRPKRLTQLDRRRRGFCFVAPPVTGSTLLLQLADARKRKSHRERLSPATWPLVRECRSERRIARSAGSPQGGSVFETAGTRSKRQREAAP